jgi:hypothetical protein
MKGAAWAAMITSYPEAKKVKVGDVERFLAVMGLTHDRGQVITFEEKKQGGALTWIDHHTGLMWARWDNGSNISWQDAKSYCENYRVGGYTDWRMPTQDELAGLYDSSSRENNSRHLNANIILTDSWYWASVRRGSEAAYFHFSSGTRYWHSQYIDSEYRALPVRSGK